MNARALVMLLVMLPGCATMSTKERAFHAMAVVDFAQTTQYRNNCIEERDPIGRRIMGEQPDKEKAALFFLARSVFYHLVNKHFEESKTWARISDFLIGANGAYIVNNQRLINRREC